METNLKTQKVSDSSPLLPVSNYPNLKSYALKKSMKSRYISIFHHTILMVKLGTILSLIYFFTTASLVPQTPSFQLHSLFLSNLNISNATFQADWDMTLNIENLNFVSAVHFDTIRGSISYRGNSLAMYSVEPFELRYREHRLVNMKISENRKTTTNEWIINRQRDGNGAVSFNLTMFVSGTYTIGWWRVEKFIVNPHCLDLKVAFLPKTSFGSWVNGGPMKCSIT